MMALAWTLCRAALAPVLLLLLQACGGTDDAAPAQPPAAAIAQLEGTVTDGLSSFTSVEVTVKGHSGLARTSLNNRAGDSHTTSLNQLTGPYLLRAARTDGVAVFSVATQAGRANLSPLTTLVVARLLAEDPETYFSALGASGGVPTTITQETVRTAHRRVVQHLARVFDLALPAGIDDFITVPFEARPGDAMYDTLLALQARLALQGSTVAQLGGQLALQAQRCRLQQLIAVPADGNAAADGMEFCPSESLTRIDTQDPTVTVVSFTDALGDSLAVRLRGDEVLAVHYQAGAAAYDCLAPACGAVVPGVPAGDGSRTLTWTEATLAGVAGSVKLTGSLVTAAPGVQLPQLPCTENFFYAIAADQSVEGTCAAGFSATRGTRRQLQGFASADGSSPLQVEVLVQDGSEISSVLLRRPDPDSGEAHYFKCLGPGCAGIAVGAVDELGQRLITLDDTPLAAVLPDGSLQPGVGLRLRGSLLGSDAVTDFSTNCSFSTEDVVMVPSDETEAVHLCPPSDAFAAATGVTFRGSFDQGDGNLGFFAANFFGDENNVALADSLTLLMQGEDVASLTLNRRDGQLFACRSTDCTGIAVSPPDDTGRRTLVFSGTSLREIGSDQLPTDRSAVLDGSFSVGPPP